MQSKYVLKSFDHYRIVPAKPKIRVLKRQHRYIDTQLVPFCLESTLEDCYIVRNFRDFIMGNSITYPMSMMTIQIRLSLDSLTPNQGTVTFLRYGIAWQTYEFAQILNDSINKIISPFGNWDYIRESSGQSENDIKEVLITIDPLKNYVAINVGKHVELYILGPKAVVATDSLTTFDTVMTTLKIVSNTNVDCVSLDPSTEQFKIVATYIASQFERYAQDMISYAKSIAELNLSKCPKLPLNRAPVKEWCREHYLSKYIHMYTKMIKPHGTYPPLEDFVSMSINMKPSQIIQLAESFDIDKFSQIVLDLPLTATFPVLDCRKQKSLMTSGFTLCTEIFKILANAGVGEEAAVEANLYRVGKPDLPSNLVNRSYFPIIRGNYGVTINEESSKVQVYSISNGEQLAEADLAKDTYISSQPTAIACRWFWIACDNRSVYSLYALDIGSWINDMSRPLRIQKLMVLTTENDQNLMRTASMNGSKDKIVIMSCTDQTVLKIIEFRAHANGEIVANEISSFQTFNVVNRAVNFNDSFRVVFNGSQAQVCVNICDSQVYGNYVLTISMLSGQSYCMAFGMTNKRTQNYELVDVAKEGGLSKTYNQYVLLKSAKTQSPACIVMSSEGIYFVHVLRANKFHTSKRQSVLDYDTSRHEKILMSTTKCGRRAAIVYECTAWHTIATILVDINA